MDVFKIQLEQVKRHLHEARHVVITAHTYPDGDAVGSSLALSRVLGQMNYETVNVVMPDPFPGFLAWLPGSESVVIFSEQTDKARRLLQQADLVFCLDYNHPNRVANMKEALQETKAVKVLIDHHIKPSGFCQVIISDIAVSSTSELLYTFLLAMGLQKYFNKQVAEALYVGIMTDTGSFSYSANRPDTFRIAADLIEYGVNPHQVNTLIYGAFSENRMRLLGHSLSDGLVLLPEYHVSYIFLSKDVLEKYDYQVGDTEGVVNYALALEHVVFCALFMERDGLVKISFRSKGDFSVHEFSKNHFNGGGHKNAAGGKMDLPLCDVITYFQNTLKQYKNELVHAARPKNLST